MKPPLLVPLAALLLCPSSAPAAQTAPAYPALPPASAAAPARPVTPTPPPTRAAAAPAAPGSAANVQGRVSAVDAAKHTLTIDPRGAAAPVVVSLASDARVYITAPGTLASLKVGDHVSVYGTATPDAPTLSTDRIVVLPAEAMRPSGRVPKRTAGFHPKRVEGTLSAVSPALTLTTLGRVAVTVTPTTAARVETLTAGSLADISIGQTVNARVSGGATAPVASEVRVLPAHVRGNKGKKSRASAGAPLAPIGLSAPAAR